MAIAGGILEKTLYALLKRHLARRELHSFVLYESGASSEHIAKHPGMEDKKVIELLVKVEQKTVSIQNDRGTQNPLCRVSKALNFTD